MRRYLYLLLVAMTVLAACQRPTKFKISGTLSDGANTNLYVKYYGNGGVMTGVTAVRDGSFEAEFPCPDPAIVEILDNDYRVLGRLYIANGDEVHIAIDRANPYRSQVTGSDISMQWAAALSENADLLASGDKEVINRVIEDYISAHPDSEVGTLMFASMYDASRDPLRADSVMSLIAPEARITSVLANYDMLIKPFVNPDSYGRVKPLKYRTPDKDSTLVFSPADRKASLMVFSNETSKRGDSIVPKIKKIYSANKPSKLQIIDIGLMHDVAVWRNIARRDSAAWTQAWVPGGILGDGLCDLAVPVIPYYIVTDSAGVQHYRGPSAEQASAAIDDILK